MQKRKKKILALSISLIIICPIVINALMLIPCKWASGDNVWIGFWGAYLGSMLSAGAAFAILYIQRRDNHKENSNNRQANQNENAKNRKLQINEIHFRQEMGWFSDFRKAIIENINVYTPHNILSIINILLQDEYTHAQNQEVQDKTNKLLEKFVQADTTVGIIIPTSMNDNLLEYNNTRKEMFCFLCNFTKDLQVIGYAILTIKSPSCSFTQKLLDRCTSTELKNILLGQEGPICKTIELWLENKYKEILNRFDDFRLSSINCVNAELNRINQILQKE
ncbi:MAG: hypothetical protein II849_07035 [Bacteroidales bacterium]|nr:hypothetical protein [Bacteroidales bacterium]